MLLFLRHQELMGNAMYFYQITNHKGQTEFVGPYLLTRSDLLNRISNADSKKQYPISEEDSLVLESAERELTLYNNARLPFDAVLRIRDRLTTYEYREVFEINAKSMSKEDWMIYCGINESQHLNYHSGRSVVKGGVCQKLHDLLISHSYVLESSAFALATLLIDGSPVHQLDYKAYGANSIKLLAALKSSRNLALEYYWSNRSHVDVMQTYIYNETYAQRKGSIDSMNQSLGNWMFTPEYSAFSATRDAKDKQHNKSRNVSNKNALNIFKLLQKSQDERLTPEQRQATKSLLQEVVGSLSAFGGMMSEADIMKWVESMVGRDTDHKIAYTEASLHMEVFQSNEHLDTQEVRGKSSNLGEDDIFAL